MGIKNQLVCIQLIIHVWLFLDVKLCKFNVVHNPYTCSSQHYDNPHYSFRCNIESQILRECIALNTLYYTIRTEHVFMIRQTTLPLIRTTSYFAPA